MPIHKRGRLWIVRREFRQVCESQVDAETLDAIMGAATVRARRRWLSGARPCPSILEALPDFIREQTIIRQNEAATLRLYARRLRLLASAFPGPIDAIGRDEIVAWAGRRLQEKGKARRYDATGSISRSTVNAELGALRRMARWLSESGRTDADLPILRSPKIRQTGQIRGNRFPPRSWTPAAVRQALSKIDERAPHVGLALRGIALLGARPEAALGLTWGAVSMPTIYQPGLVRLEGLKGQAEGCVPVDPGSPLYELLIHARALFRSMRRRRPGVGDPVFTTRRGRSARRPDGWTSDSFSREVGRLAKELGLGDFRPYTIRHSAVSWLQSEPGVSLADVQAYARHARITTQEAYAASGAVLQGTRPAAAYDAIGRILAANGGDGQATDQEAAPESATA